MSEENWCLESEWIQDCTGAIKFTVAQGHGSLAALVQTPQGVVA